MIQGAWATVLTEIRGPLVSLLVGVITLGIAVNAGTDLLVQRIGRSWTVVLAVVATIAIILLARPIRSLALILRSRLQANVVELGGPVRGHRGLIVLASAGPGITSAESAIRYHLGAGGLEHCWLVTGGPGSEASAAGLIQKFVGEGVPISRFRLLPLKQAAADNPEAVYGRIKEAYDEAADLRLREDEVIGDYTGGTKSMTAGMILACASPRRHLQFMKPRQYTPEGRAEPGAESDPVAIDIRFELMPL